MGNLNNNEDGYNSNPLRKTGSGGSYYDFHVCRDSPKRRRSLLVSMKLERDKKMILRGYSNIKSLVFHSSDVMAQ